MLAEGRCGAAAPCGRECPACRPCSLCAAAAAAVPAADGCNPPLPSLLPPCPRSEAADFIRSSIVQAAVNERGAYGQHTPLGGSAGGRAAPPLPAQSWCLPARRAACCLSAPLGLTPGGLPFLPAHAPPAACAACLPAELAIGEDQIGGLVEEVTPDMKLVGAAGACGVFVCCAPHCLPAAPFAGLLAAARAGCSSGLGGALSGAPAASLPRRLQPRERKKKA